ncbi:MFS transporter [Novosphingobium pentaromativorans]|nr:MFS transporter [Novosphingobium pentaromativorans]
MKAGLFKWYRGWTMVAMGIVMVMLSVGSVVYGYSIYLTPVSKELGLARETANVGIVFQHIGSALLAPVIGRILDFVKVRTVVAFCGLALGAGLIGLGFGDALWAKAVLLVLPLSLGLAGAGAVASYVLVARWFKVHRGRAMTIVAFGQSAASVIVAPLIAMLIEEFGWREALLIQGIFVGAAMLLIAAGLVDRPAEGEHEPLGKAVPVPEADLHDKGEIGHPLTLRQIASSPVFWMLAAIVSATLAVVQASIASLVPLATGRGISLVQATTLLSMLGISGIFGKTVLAIVADRFQRITLITVAIAIIMCFTLSLTVDAGFAGLAASSLMAGMAIGGFFPMYSALLADVFGAHSLGTTEGLVAPAISLSSAGAIYLAGVTYDVSGDYRLTFLIFSAILLGALVLSATVRLFGNLHEVRPKPV